MLEMIDISVENAVAYRLGGKITDEEMSQVFSALKEKIDQYGKVSIYQEIESFKGVELEGMVEKVKFFLDVGISKFDKIAVVVGSDWLQKIIDLEGKLFRKFEMRGFSMDEKDQAVQFLKGESL
jgi:hypothetical protein